MLASELHFLNKDLDPESPNFGILKINVANNGILNKRHHFILCVDRSGSMSLRESDGMTKLEHVQHTLRNIIEYLTVTNNEIVVSIISFDDEIDVPIKEISTTKENKKKIINAIDDLFARNATNISGAINEANKIRELDKTPNTEFNVILLTDGNPTVGLKTPNDLINIINTDFNTNFIGYGVEHNEELLTALGNCKNCDNYFVESAENAGCVYGEILHKALHKTITNIKINTKNMVIYDWKLNDWTKSITIDSLPGGVEKIYHVLYTMPTKGFIDKNWIFISKPGSSVIEYIVAETKKKNRIQVDAHCDAFEHYNESVKKYVFRQKVLVIMARVNSLKAKINSTPIYVWEEEKPEPELDKLCCDLKQLGDEIKTEMTKILVKSNVEYQFMENLLDDIVVTEKSIYSRYGAMFRLARHKSQGEQRAYNLKNIDNLHEENAILTPLKLTRSGNDNQNAPLSLTHTMSQSDHSPYAADDQIRVMRQCSNK